MQKSFKLLVGAMLWTGLTALQAQATSAPVYHEVIPLELSYGGLSPGLYAAPYAVDLNADDRVDLVVGDADGQVIAFYNSRVDGFEVWFAETVFDAVTGDPLRFIGPARPVVVDVLEDGWLDLMVGEGDGGLQLCNLNSYERPLRMWCNHLMYEEAPLTVPGGMAAPTVVDLQLSGELDLAIGAGDGRIYLYENQGTNMEPQLLFMGILGMWPDGRAATTPTFADLNRDWTPDLVTGAADGSLTICRGLGGPCFPLLIHEPGALRAANFGASSAPSLADINSDGMPDVVVGNAAGEVYWMPGHALRSDIVQVPGETDEMYQARLAAAVLEPAEGIFAEGKPQWLPNYLELQSCGHASPVPVDADGVNGPDLVLGDGSGHLAILYNHGLETPDFYYAESDLHFTFADPFHHEGVVRPMLYDFGGNGIIDVVAGVEGLLQACTLADYNRPLTFQCQPMRMTNKHLIQMERPAMTATDWDGDGSTDFMVGGADGMLRVYHNHGTNALPVLQPPGRLFTTAAGILDVGANAVPVVTDLDGDGEADLLVGSADGRLTVCPRMTGPCLPVISYEAKFYGPLDVGTDAAPMLADFNSDGHEDLLVGNAAGELWYFAADWALQHEE